MAIITVAPVKTAHDKKQQRYNVGFVAISSALMLFAFEAMAQDAAARNKDHIFIPAIEVLSHGYMLETPQFDGTDRGAALELVPSLTWLYNRQHVSTRIMLERQQVVYKDAQRSDFAFNEVDFFNELSFFDRQLLWTVNAAQKYSIRSGGEFGAGIFRDKITNAGELSKNNRRGTTLQLSNPRHRKTQYLLSLSGQSIDSERPDTDDLFGDISNKQYTVSVNTSRSYRHGGLYWRANGRISETQRTTNTTLERQLHRLQLGLPLFGQLAFITKGSHEENSIQNSEFSNIFSTAGAGLEWHFGQASRINVTYNTVLKGAEKTEYAAVDFDLAPSRRTLLSGAIDKRYFGYAKELTGHYHVKFLTARLSYKEDVNTRSFLETELTDLGIFVCPPGNNSIDSCTTMPRPDYRPIFGQQIIGFSQIDTIIRDDVVLNQQGMFSLGYNRHRLSTSLQLSSSKITYVETERVDRRYAIGLENTYRLSQFSLLRLNVRALDYRFGTTGREDRNTLLVVGVKRDLSKFSELDVSVKHSRRDSSDGSFDYQENRLTLSYKYQFK